MKRTKEFRTLRFAFCIYFAFCILHSALALPAFAAENPTTTDKGATISVTGSYDPNGYARMISVDVAWGSMVFTYSDGAEWDPQNHTNKEEGGWSSEGNSITLTNHSNADILANLVFTPNVRGFGGYFYDSESYTSKVSAVSLASAMGTLWENAPSATVWFRAEEGTLSGDVESLGTLTVTLHDTLTAIDAREMDAEQLYAAVEAALANDPASLHITMPADANYDMLSVIQNAIGGGPDIDLILYGMAEKIEYLWSDNIDVTLICGNHDMSVYTPGNGERHTVTCKNCDYSTSESCTVTHTSGGNGTHISSCECGYSDTVNCDLSNVVYTWADDDSTCTASATCTVCKAEITETVNGAYNAQGVLVAEFTNPLFEAQKITHEHEWAENGCTICGIASYSYDETTNTYTVYSTEGLYAWLEAVQNDLTLNLTLMADITLPNTDLTTGAEITVENGVPSGSNWTPISTDWEKCYIGTFDGNGHTITGLRINGGETNYISFIGCLGDGKGAGEVKNLTLADAVLYSTATHIGGFAGCNWGGTISGCTFGSTTDNSSVFGASTEYSLDAGGIVGYTDGGSVSSCTNNGTVSAFGTDASAGGIVADTSDGSVLSCTNNGTVSAFGTDASAGGIVAYCFETSVSDCTNNGTVSSTAADDGNAFAGGIVGYCRYNSTVSGCTNNGTVSATGPYIYAGGIVGYNENSEVSGCTNEGEASGTGSTETFLGGIVGFNSGGTVDDTNKNTGEPTTNVGNE